jgi:hypothetical protein
MRTKTLILTAALVAAGVATSMAQVYSKNVVGYVSKTLYPGFNLICNPLIQTDTTIGTLLPTVPHNTSALLFDNAGAPLGLNYDTDLGGWDNPGITLDLGKGVFLTVPAGSPDTVVTIVGEVFQGTGAQAYNAAVNAGYSFRSSPVPQALNFTALGLTSQHGDAAQRYNRTGGAFSLEGYNYDTDLGGWDAEPTLDVGEAFFYTANGTAASIQRSFTVPTGP